MAKVYLKLSTRVQSDTGKAEVLLRYRNTREIGQRVHSHVFILPKFFVDGEIVIKQRLITPEVQEARAAKLEIDRIIAHLIEKGDKKAIVHSYDIDPHSYDVDPLEEGRAFKEQSLFACKQAAA